MATVCATVCGHCLWLLFVATVRSYCFVATVCGYCLWLLFCGYCLWPLFVATVCGHCLWLLFVAPPVSSPPSSLLGSHHQRRSTPRPHPPILTGRHTISAGRRALVVSAGRRLVVIPPLRLYPPHRASQHECRLSWRRLLVPRPLSSPLSYSHRAALSTTASCRGVVFLFSGLSSPSPPILTRAALSTCAGCRGVVFCPASVLIAVLTSGTASILTPPGLQHECRLSWRRLLLPASILSRLLPGLYPHPRGSQHECRLSRRRLLVSLTSVLIAVLTPGARRRGRRAVVASSSRRRRRVVVAASSSRRRRCVVVVIAPRFYSHRYSHPYSHSPAALVFASSSSLRLSHLTTVLR